MNNGDRKRTPVPNKNIEAKSSGSGPVKTYSLTPEEYEKYFGQPMKPVLDADGKPEKVPINTSLGRENELKKSKSKFSHLTKEFFESEFAKGKTGVQIAQETGMPIGSLPYYLKKLGVVNPNNPNNAKGAGKKDVEVVKSETKPEYKVEPEPKPAAEPKTDMINHPDHYTAGGIEVIDIMKAKMTAEQFEGYLLGNIVKYTFRYRLKNGLEDIKKARWYLDKLIEVKSSENSQTSAM